MVLRLSALAAAALILFAPGASAQETPPELEVIGTRSLIILEESVLAEIARRADQGDPVARQRRFEQQMEALEEPTDGFQAASGGARRSAGPGVPDFWHFYGGLVPPGLDDHAAVTGFFGGVGRTWGRLFVAGDGHFLEHAGILYEYEPALFAGPAGAGSTASAALGLVGLDASFGGVVPLLENRLDIIPLVVVGFTRLSAIGEVGSYDFSYVDSRANAGGGGALVWRFGERMGVRSAVRWTRNYGLAVDVGFVLAVN